MDKVPFQNVDRKGFKEMVKTLDPRYALPAPTQHTIKHLLFPEMEVA
jgi:hypothetical protein